MSIGSIGRWVGGLFGFGLLCTACGGTASHENSNDTTRCTPGTQRCDGHQIKRCDDSGAGESVWQSCSSTECRVQNGVASCAPTACAAGTGVCNGTIATTCLSDGSGPTSGGTDCAQTGQYCVDGTCKDTLCVGGKNSCKDGDLYQCSMDGRRLTLLKDCTSSEVCDATIDTCLSRVCEPGQSGCFGDLLATCSSSGGSWLPATTDCKAQGKVCLDGSCRSQGCTPSGSFCSGNNVYQCDPMGVRGTLSKTCDAQAEHCEATAAGQYAFCVKNACVAGKIVCDGNTIKVCNADNTLPEDGIACKDDELCDAGKCKPRGCGNVQQPYCMDNDVYNCDAVGPALLEQCDPASPCQVIADPVVSGTKEINFGLVSCVPLACTPAQIGCVGNKIGSCESQGASLSGEVIDCEASNQVCTTQMTCATSVTDVIGEEVSVTDLAGDTYVGNVVSVQSARKLTELQAWLRRDTAHDLRWIIFEQVDNQLISRAETTAPAASGSGFVSSGPLDFRLEAGKRYALGVALPLDVVAQTTTQAPISFGSVLGTAVADPDVTTSVELATAFSGGSALYMKVTTEAP
ncbi:MAG TPA: hypothetical protein VER96_01685 [Polyangiaceae bacterium]|nr:hypothetical protein [Polyangiaceae bacterium]